MKIKQLQKLQSLQDAYASLTGLTILMTDPNGNWVTEISGAVDLIRLLLKAQKLPVDDRLQLILEKMQTLEKPIIYETERGFKLVVAPIRISGQTVYYIIAGIMIEEGSKELIAQKFFGDVPSERDMWKQALQAAPSFDQERLTLLFCQLQQLVGIMQIMLVEKDERGKTAYRLQLLNIVNLMDSSDPNWLQGILKVFLQVMELEFAGIAIKSAEEKLEITETMGFNEQASLQGASFFNGEGLLGQVSLTKQMGYWEMLDRDPRAEFFRTRGVKPKIIICYPIKQKNQLFGLLFGGNSSTLELSEERADMGALLANQLAVDINRLESEAFDERRRVRIEILQELSQVILSIKEKEYFFRRFIELLQQALQSSFICLALRNQGDLGISLYVSPNSSKEINTEYAVNLEMTYFGVSHSSFTMFRKPVTREWKGQEWGEFPLVFEEKLIGVIGVHYNDESKHKECMPFLNAMNMLVITKLQLAATKSLSPKTDIAALLHQTLLAWKPDAFYKALKVKDLTQRFLKQLEGSLEDVEWVGEAGLLSEFEPALLSSWIGETPAVGLLREAERFRVGDYREKDIGMGSYVRYGKLLCIVMWYCEHGDEKWLETLPISLEGALKRSFEYFLSTETVLADEVTPPRSLEIKGRFTPREEEILKHVLLGLNNLEIAKELHISTHTVKNHITKIYEKLGVVDRAHALAKMYQTAMNPSKEK